MHTHVNTPCCTHKATHALLYTAAERGKITFVADRQTVLIYFKECPILENMCQYEARGAEAKLLQHSHVMN